MISIFLPFRPCYPNSTTFSSPSIGTLAEVFGLLLLVDESFIILDTPRVVSKHIFSLGPYINSIPHPLDDVRFPCHLRLPVTFFITHPESPVCERTYGRCVVARRVREPTCCLPVPLVLLYIFCPSFVFKVYGPSLVFYPLVSR